MQNAQLNRAINLIKKTGDKMVIMDNESDAAMMLMDLGAYEKMLDRSAGVEKLTEEELLEKINRDVAVWRAHNEQEKIETYDEVVEKPVVAPKPAQARMAERVVLEEKGPEMKMEPEQSVGDIVAEEEEEKFYLEPVE